MAVNGGELRHRIAAVAGRRGSGRIPIATVSGVASTTPGMIEWFDRRTPVTMITTKSIQRTPNPGNREPIIVEPAPGCFGNAVGLRNPGIQRSIENLVALRRRDTLSALLTVSLSAATTEDFVALATSCVPVADVVELNYSCPHAAAGYGADIGRDESAIAEITAAVVAAVPTVPVLVKLTPTVSDVARMAGVAVGAGACGVTAINTAGPAVYLHARSGVPILSNPPDGRGGTSGRWIHGRALEVVAAVRAAVGAGPVIVGMGGVTSPEEAAALYDAGADIVGVGSALSRVHQRHWGRYLASLSSGGTHADQAPAVRADADMAYRDATVAARRDLGAGLFELDLSPGVGATPGQTVFLWIPGVGEKPFAPAVTTEEYSTFLIKRRGPFTEAAAALTAGDPIYIRGPYGDSWQPPRGADAPSTWMLLGAGSGAAALPAVAATIIAAGGAVTTAIGLREELTAGVVTGALESLGALRIIPDAGRPGRVIGAIGELCAQEQCDGAWVCGPEPFMEASAEKLVAAGIDPARIYLSLERSMRCGVGMCGECHHGGRLTCQYGTVLSWNAYTEVSR